MTKIYFIFLLIMSWTCFSKKNASLVKFTNPTSVFTPKGIPNSVEIDLINCKTLLISG